MYERILLPLDGSPLAEQALPYAHILGKALDSQIHFLRVFDPISQQMADPDHGLYIDMLATAARNEAEEYLKQVRLPFRKVRGGTLGDGQRGGPGSPVLRRASHDC